MLTSQQADLLRNATGEGASGESKQRQRKLPAGFAAWFREVLVQRGRLKTEDASASAEDARFRPAGNGPQPKSTEKKNRLLRRKSAGGRRRCETPLTLAYSGPGA